MTKIDDALVERMVKLVRSFVDGSIGAAGYPEACAIVALLPEPVDPDLTEARELFIEVEGGIDADADIVRDVRHGAADKSDEARLLLKGLKRGRELERLSRSGGEA